MFEKNKQCTLDKFGKFLVENLRDGGIYFAENLINNKWKSTESIEIQTILQTLSEEQVIAVKQSIIKSIDAGIHDFLFAIQEDADFENEIQITVDGKNIVEISDGIQGEMQGEDGWIEKFSKFKK